MPERAFSRLLLCGAHRSLPLLSELALVQTAVDRHEGAAHPLPWHLLSCDQGGGLAEASRPPRSPSQLTQCLLRPHSRVGSRASVGQDLPGAVEKPPSIVCDWGVGVTEDGALFSQLLSSQQRSYLFFVENLASVDWSH